MHLAECRCKASAKLQKVHIRVMIQKWRELSSSQTVLRLEKSRSYPDKLNDLSRYNFLDFLFTYWFVFDMDVDREGMRAFIT